MTALGGADTDATGVVKIAEGPKWAPVGLAAILVLSVLLGAYDYAVFHTVAEVLGTVVAVSVWIVAYHTRRLLDNHYLLFVGMGFLFFAALGIPHTLGFKGVALFAGFDNDLPTQAFIAQRFLLAATFLIAPVFLRRRVHLAWTFAGYALVVGVVLMSLFVWRNFPSMFVEGVGLTPLKKGLEYALSLMFVLSGVLLYQRRDAFDVHVLRMMLATLACLVASEVSFTLYATPFGLSNFAGHLFQIAAFYFAYRAVVVTALVTPFRVLFLQLSERERSLHAANGQLNALAEISDTAMSTLELDELLPALLGRLVAVMGADAAVLLELQDGRLEPRSTIGVLKEGGVGTMLEAPLRIGTKVLGALHVHWHEHHNASENEEKLLDIVADRIALALRNAQLYQSEHRIAQVLQESLLSLPAEVPGIEYARTYHSATQAARVGGDFYDLFELDGGHVALLIGDVSGKGVDAAVLTSLVRNTVKSHSHQGQSSPAEVLKLTNSMVERYSDASTFVTLFFGILDRRAGRLVYSNAGHTAVVLVSCDGSSPRLLPSNSPIVGAWPEAQYVDAQAHIGEGETLVMYTDGLIEARSPGGLFGEDRLFELIRTIGDCDPQETIDRILEELMAFTGGRLTDDLALLAIRLLPPVLDHVAPPAAPAERPVA